MSRSSAASAASFTGAGAGAAAVADLNPRVPVAAAANSLCTGEAGARREHLRFLSLILNSVTLALLPKVPDVPSQLSPYILSPLCPPGTLWLSLVHNTPSSQLSGPGPDAGLLIPSLPLPTGFFPWGPPLPPSPVSSQPAPCPRLNSRSRCLAFSGLVSLACLPIPSPQVSPLLLRLSLPFSGPLLTPFNPDPRLPVWLQRRSGLSYGKEAVTEAYVAQKSATPAPHLSPTFCSGR